MQNNEQEPGTPADDKGTSARPVRITVMTDLPERLPLISGMVDIVHAHLGELLGRMIANDNAEGEP